MSFDDLVETARAALQEKIDATVKKYGLGSYEAFTVDQTRGVMEFTRDGAVALRAKATIVGSVGENTGTWMWGWANESLLPKVTAPLKKVRAYGEEHGFEPLTAAVWDGDEGDGWSMAAVAAHVLGSEGCYRIPGATAKTFVLLDRIKPVKKKTKKRGN